jgi:hypothetical protein
MITGYLFAILTGFFFGLQGTYGKWVANKFPAAFLTWASFAFAMPIVLVLFFVDGIPPIAWFDFAWSASASFILNLVAWNLFFRALSISPLYLTMPFSAFTPFSAPRPFKKRSEAFKDPGGVGSLSRRGGDRSIPGAAIPGSELRNRL